MMQFGGRSDPATWQTPGIAAAQYWTGQPVLPAPESSGCERLYAMERGKTWWSHNGNACANALVNINCPPGQQSFKGACGCGCEPHTAPTRTLCSSKDRSAKCQFGQDPVCASKVASAGRVLDVTFLNGCAACQDPNVEYYTKGRC